MALIATLNFDINQPTKAQKPPQTIKLRSITNEIDSCKASAAHEPEIKVKQVKYVQQRAQLTVQTEKAAGEQQLQQTPSSPRLRPQRQIKYLGLCIEKDAEYEEDPEFHADQIERVYYPIRENYIEIVKHCRRATMESFERKGRSDLKRTAR